MTRMARMLFVAVAMLSVSKIAHSDQATAVEAKADKGVLAAVVSLQCEGKNRGNVLLSSKPSAPNAIDIGHPRGVTSDQIAALVSRTEANNVLPKGIECPRVRVVSHTKLKAAFDRPAKHPMEFPVPAGVLIPIGANTGFKDTFPDIGILLRLSMPVYSETRDAAVVYFSEDCGGLCAHGEYVQLQRVNGRWRVIRRIQAWTSWPGVRTLKGSASDPQRTVAVASGAQGIWNAVLSMLHLLHLASPWRRVSHFSSRLRQRRRGLHQRLEISYPTELACSGATHGIWPEESTMATLSPLSRGC